LRDAERLGISVSLQLLPHQMPGWALDQWPAMAQSHFGPFQYDVTHPRALAVLEAYNKTVGDFLRAEPRFHSVSIADAPRFRITGEPMRLGFIEYLAARFESTTEINLAWRTRFASFDDMEIRWDWDKRAYQLHLQRYHRDHVTEWFDWIAATIGPNIQSNLLFTAPGSALTIASGKDGIDAELINAAMDASGCETTPENYPAAYAIPFPGVDMQIALLQAAHPQKPVYNFNDVPAPMPGEGHPRAERARLWLNAIAGAELSVAPFESLFETAGGELTPANTRRLDGYLTGGQTLDRLAPEVAAFRKQTAPVAIVWSDSSRVFEDGSLYLPSVRKAYEGAVCFGLPVRFVSERQMAAGALDSVELLMLPAVTAMRDDAFAALEAYVSEGGRMISEGSTIPYTEDGTSRALRLPASPLTKTVHRAKLPSDYLRALDAAFIASDLDEIPRPTDALGYPILGVIGEYLNADNSEYLFLLNVTGETHSIHLATGRREGRDLIEGRPAVFPLNLEPLDPMLIRFAPLADTAEPESAPAEQGIPTAIVAPIGAEES
jgi:hypothetical protein